MRALAAMALLVACADEAPTIPRRYWGRGPAPHASTLALTPDGRRALVLQQDGDAVSLVDLEARAVVRELALGPTPTAAPDGRWEPPLAPAALALAPHRARAYVAARNGGELVAIDLEARAVLARAAVCAEPASVLVGPSEASVLVACAADAELLVCDPTTLAVRARVALDDEPGALALSESGGAYVVHPRTGGVTRVDVDAATVRARGAVPAMPDRGHPLRANGAPRALTDLAQRPGTGELWVLHTLVSTVTAQPVLNFETTVFPAVTALDVEAPARALRPTITTDSRLADTDGALAHVASGPRALAFTPDGARALVLHQNSENLTLVDGARGVEVGYLEDLPGRLMDGVVVHPDGARAWVSARNTGTLVPLALEGDRVRVAGPPFAARTRDPMPAALRTGQWMFYNANDRYQQFPITVNRWLSCESCHTGGGGAAVTQRVAVGPRDIPDLRQGLDGFLMRTATRRAVSDFWRSIHVEQGGSLRPDDEPFGPSLEALWAYVTHALPPLRAPRTDPARVARGRALFLRDDVGCARCHTLPRGTDSGAGNPSLDLAGPVRLHDVGTCARGGPWPDRPHEDIARHARDACRFDTPTLRGVARTGPWLHDGSAPTLRDVLTSRNADGLHGSTRHLSPDDLDALVEFLRAL